MISGLRLFAPCMKTNNDGMVRDNRSASFGFERFDVLERSFFFYMFIAKDIIDIDGHWRCEHIRLEQIKKNWKMVKWK